MTSGSLTPVAGVAAAQKHCVILVHGISTRGYWMHLAKKALRDNELVCESTSYGKFSLLKFLSPIGNFKKHPVERVINDIESIIRIHNPDKISIIAHSFGTWVISKIMLIRPDFKFHRIIFCGSVLREDFPIDRLIGRFDAPLLNEVGGKDYWPTVAEKLSSDFGAVGSHGFNRPGVETRWHEGFRHSDFLTRSFIESQWIPFLKDGKTLAGDAPPRSSSISRIFTTVSAALFVLGLAFWYFRDDSLKQPEVPVGSFAFYHPHQNDPDPGWRVWTPTGANGWMERYERGNETRFRVVGSDEIDGCNGTVVKPTRGDPDFSVLIPEKGCGQKSLLFRRGNGRWIPIGSLIQIDRR